MLPFDIAGSQRHVGDKVGTEVKDQRAGRDGDALTDELSRGWVGLGEVRLPEVLEHGALLLSRGDNVSHGSGGADGDPITIAIGPVSDFGRKQCCAWSAKVLAWGGVAFLLYPVCAAG